MGVKRKFLRNFFLAVAAFVLFVAGSLVILSRPETVSYVIGAATVKSPWKISFEDLHWNPFRSSIRISGLHVSDALGGKDGRAKEISIRYRPLDFLRGKLVISSLELDDVKLLFPKTAAPARKKPFHLNIARLFLLQNIIIRDSVVRGVDVSFAGDVNLKTDELRFELSPSFLGDTELMVRLDGLALAKGERSVAQAASLTVKASTTLSKWGMEFPYLNALKGSLNIEDGRLEALSVDRLDAKLKYLDSKLVLEPFAVVISGRDLTGSLSADTDTRNFEARFDIPKPVTLPYIGRELVTFDTAGDLSGSVKISGSGFLPSESQGKAEADFVHRFRISPEVPIGVHAKAEWKRGQITIPDGRVVAGADAIKFDGLVDIAKKKMSFKGSGTGFPVELLFDKFKNEHFHPIFGRSDVTAGIEGWGKAFKAKVKGTTRDGGYKPIVAELVETDLEATYDNMAFKWNVIQGGRHTGSADLNIRLGKKTADNTRAKDIDLKGRLDRHPVGESLSSIGLSGTGTGEITIKGPHLNFTGRATAEIVDGKLHGLPFDRVAAVLDIARKKIVFRDVDLAIAKFSPQHLEQPLTIDLVAGSFRLWGDPGPGLTIDTSYQYAPKRWQIKKISYLDDATGSRLDVSGSVATGGAISLNAGGAVDLSLLAPLGFLVREASGPAELKLSVSGPASNPAVNGRLDLKGCSISPRKVRLPLEHVKGALLFSGHSIGFEGVTGAIDDGRFSLKGGITHSGLSVAGSDLVLEGKNLRYRTEDNSFRMEFDGDLKLTGQFPQPLLAGDINILDGKYTKDFNIFESLTAPSAVAKKQKEMEITFSPRLDLRIRNTGDLMIKNNVGDIWLRSDLQIKGTRKKPEFVGVVDVVEGKIRYMNLDFDITRGFMELRDSANPYLEATAQKEINIYNVTIVAHGTTDNLALDLSATSPSGPLEKRDVISLIMFGLTETERQQYSAQTGQQFGVSMAAQQLTHVVEKPISKFAHLDTFRLEAADPTSQTVSRVKVGKQISDRLNIDFATDINTQDATQTVTGEYLITDNILLKGSQSSNGRYEIDGAIRFRLR